MNQDSMIKLFDHVLGKCPDAVTVKITADSLTVERPNPLCCTPSVSAVSSQQSLSVPEAANVPVTTAVINTAQSTVNSPIVGTFYASPSPQDPPFVSVGQKINKGQVLCIVEAMKTMNEIESDYDGTVTQILAKNGDLVEFGQTLFIIE